jgi:16S rRNA (cytosine967-C5)-methyltransferase
MGRCSLETALTQSEVRIAAADRSLLRMLCFGTLRRHWRLQSWIDVLIDRPIRRRDSVINALLAVGLFQLSETRIPDHAVVSQTVEATRLLRRPKLAGLLNAVLRRFVRESMAETKHRDHEAIFDHPQWLIDAIAHDWPDDWKDILTANNSRAPMWLRVNSQHTAAAEYIEQLAAQDIGSSSLTGLASAVRLHEPLAVAELPGFADGHVSVQDAAAQLAAPWLLDGVRGRVLDACAAPGGKSGHLLELGGPDIALTCIEKDEARAADLSANLARLGLDATVRTADASNPHGWWDGQPFDAILLDAPCSASGVIRRHPDIKLLRRESDIAALAQQQFALLGALWPLLASGGRLLYVTCSVLATENDAVVGRFLGEAGDARENDLLQNNNIRDLMRRKACGYQILPRKAELDGFYYACLEKVI